MEFIAVVLHGETSAKRFEDARTLLNYGFANYSLVSLRPGEALPPVPVTLGKADSVQPKFTGQEFILGEKGSVTDVQYGLSLAEELAAPVAEGQELGQMTVRSGDTVLAQVRIVAAESVERLGFWTIYGRLLGTLFGRKLG